MKRLSLALAALVTLTTVSAMAQAPASGTAPENGARAERPARTSQNNYPNISPGEIQATPEMWFYEQAMRQYNDPNVAVRRAAEFRADQRTRRIESRRWYGLSNARPQASVDPLHGDYSPGWTSNAPYSPYRWVGVGEPWVGFRTEGSRSY